ncbi:MAG TPA: D-alanyl-D-alanine carboxypeptidase/D-alanyl-D-alanine-endopeptidase [candidate division WOR-3 bacterium]|uniref:D-alanyl-D-alanine carboxypeptidase/D-alanyl-D-alanine-endopeptidase n=1 Tax=candidate division WOR-3 bacterium TaxID=2052148 RepID=A0A9C9EML1_UNCW3|nr:D-alanyl-D-alanine carboxypeptidase/D-alanyl-D-alanine-endopeptidase [candidate division WOR-3 bacterium]
MILMIYLFSLVSLDSILNQADLGSANYGIYVLNLSNDSVVYARFSQKLLIPASNMKIVTSGAGLFFLGPEHRFKTRLGFQGKIEKDRLKGDLVIIGGGDPMLELEDLEQFILALKNRKIKEIEGDIILDDTYFTELSLNGNNFRFERLPVGWAWHYLDARYAPEVSALSINKNCVNVRIEATRVGDYADVVIEPETEYVKLINDMRTKEGEDSIIILRRPEANIIYVSGGIGAGHTRNIEVSVKDPALFFGTCFKERLLKEGIEFKGRLRRAFEPAVQSGPLVILDSIVSEPLLHILHELNVESVNLYAETLLKTLGARYYGEGSFVAGIRMLKRFLAVCGADTGRVSLWDGSGLSRHNLISPYQISLVLRYLYLSRYASAFFELLPSSGEGTLERRFQDFDGYLRAKTGTLHAVSCLSGYLHINDTDYCFSMLFNNFVRPRKEIERLQEEIIRALYENLTGDGTELQSKE